MATVMWIAGVAVVLVGGGALIRAWRQASARRLVVCPESRDTQSVELDPLHRLTHGLRGDDTMRLRDCSRWPERSDCDQPCLEQIAHAPDGCRVRALLDTYYAGENCVLCGKEFGEQIDWYEKEPAFMDSERHIIKWKELPAEQLPELMETHYPLCWDCKVIESVRQKHPERITDRLLH